MELRGAVVLPNRILEYGRVVCSGGKITAVEELEKPERTSEQYILPGLVDIHNHGTMLHDYMEATEEAFDAITHHLTSHGITTAQCTTVSAPVERILRCIQFYRKQLKKESGGRPVCRLAGIHIEGPYIAPENKGAHPLDTLLTPEDGYLWILENSDVIREVTVAPELPGMARMIRDLRARGIVVSGGHDHAELEDVRQAAESGMTHCTHIYCAMSTLHKTNGHRRCGLTEYAMTHDNLTAEIIADNHHVPPLLARMVYQAKGPEKLCVVSDAISPSGLPESPEVYQLGAGEGCTKVIVESGVAMVADRSCYEESVILAAEFRKAIICEKPAALSREVFARMLDAVRKARVALNVGHVIRYWPEYAYAKKLYDGGQFGNIRYARATRMSCVSARARKGGWFTKPDRSGGGLFDLHIHDVDYFCYLFGKVKSVYACGSRNSAGSWNYVCSTLNFENGISAVAEGISEMPQGFPFTMELNIVGDQQALCYHMGAGENLYNIHEAGRMTHVYSNEKEPETVCLEHPDAYFLELRDFIDHVKAGTPVEVITPEAVDYTLRVLAAIKQSLETGKVVSVME